jgi:hypothetical protein
MDRSRRALMRAAAAWLAPAWAPLRRRMESFIDAI